MIEVEKVNKSEEDSVAFSIVLVLVVIGIASSVLFTDRNVYPIENVGYRGDKMVLLDYGYFSGTPDWYIGN